MDISFINGDIKCEGCANKATKQINNKCYCSHCGDNKLIKIIAKCIKHIEEANVNLKIIPKGIDK